MTHLSEQDDAQSEVNTSVSRRTIMAGAAWTVPVIVTATASPAIAATAAPNLVWDSGTISRNPSWNGQDSDGRGYVDANDTMFADYKVSNNGTASADGYSISIDLPQGIVRGVPTASSDFTYAGSSNYTSGGNKRTVYTFTTSSALAAGASRTTRISWQLADGNTIKNEFGGQSVVDTFASGYVSRSDGSRVRTDYLNTGLKGTPNFNIRT